MEFCVLPRVSLLSFILPRSPLLFFPSLLSWPRRLWREPRLETITNPPKAKCTGPNRTPGEEASSLSRSRRKQTRRRRRKMWRSGDTFFSPFLPRRWTSSQQKPGKMARTRTRMLLALALLGIFLLLDVSVKGEVRGQQQAEEEEEERSCQGAFDLYFVLDKWVSDIIYGFVLLSPRCALPCNRPVFFLEAHGTSLSFSPLCTFLRELAALQLPIWEILSKSFRFVS